VQEDGDLVATGTASFNDVDQGDVLSYSVQGGGAGTYGSLSINANGEWTYSLNNGSAAVQALNAGPSVQDTFTVVADDGNGGLATQDVSINVDGANEPFSMAGARLNYQYYYPDLSSPYGSASNGTYTVGPGVEVSNMAGGNLAYMDMREDNFLYISFNTGYGGSSYFYDRDFNGFVVTDIYDDMPDIVGVDIRPNRMGLDEADVAIANDSVSVNWAGKNFDPYTVIEIELLFA
jgi:VCBS repeat-containing protein